MNANALFDAIRAGDLATVQKCAANANANKIQLNYQPPLFYAAVLDRLDIVSRSASR
jgi:hypothetical protein